MNTPQSESALQSQIVQWLRWSLPGDAFVTAFPAGGGGKIRGAKLKRTGLVPGCPDLWLVWNGGLYVIELKTKRGTLSDDQKECRLALMFAGAHWGVARSVAEVELLLNTWSIPIKSRIAA